MFKLEFATDNAAFADDHPGEIVRILREIADEARRERTGGAVYDLNGNRVGQWSLNKEE